MIALIDPEPLDSLARLYGALRSITADAECSCAEKLGALKLVEFELLRQLQSKIDEA